MTSLREQLIAQGSLVPADRVEPRAHVLIDLGVPVLRLLGSERWQSPRQAFPFEQGDLKP
jgi:hypothetical protein